MNVDPAAAGARETYRLMINLITPRPIAWVSTVSPAGVSNLAPFSFFNGVGATPPTLMFSAVNRRDGGKKDTVVNIEATREFVVNVVSFPERVAMNATSEDLPYGVSELERFGLSAAPSHVVKPPRVKESRAHFECVLHQIVEVGQGPLAANVVIGRIVLISVADEILKAGGAIDPVALATIGRMGGETYVATTDTFDLPRPGANPKTRP